jgi:hypothetical protein
VRCIYTLEVNENDYMVAEISVVFPGGNWHCLLFEDTFAYYKWWEILKRIYKVQTRNVTKYFIICNAASYNNNTKYSAKNVNKSKVESLSEIVFPIFETSK